MERVKIRREAANIRGKFLKENPYCKRCRSLATEMHHIKPVIAGGTNSKRNLAPLCSCCHREVEIWNSIGLILLKKNDYRKIFNVFLHSPSTSWIAAMMISSEKEDYTDDVIDSLVITGVNERRLKKKLAREHI